VVVIAGPPKSPIDDYCCREKGEKILGVGLIVCGDGVRKMGTRLPGLKRTDTCPHIHGGRFILQANIHGVRFISHSQASIEGAAYIHATAGRTRACRSVRVDPFMSIIVVALTFCTKGLQK
jgi:hypothetical protein